MFDLDRDRPPPDHHPRGAQAPRPRAPRRARGAARVHPPRRAGADGRQRPELAVAGHRRRRRPRPARRPLPAGWASATWPPTGDGGHDRPDPPGARLGRLPGRDPGPGAGHGHPVHQGPAGHDPAPIWPPRFYGSIVPAAWSFQLAAAQPGPGHLLHHAAPGPRGRGAPSCSASPTTSPRWPCCRWPTPRATTSSRPPGARSSTSPTSTSGRPPRRPKARCQHPTLAAGAPRRGRRGTRGARSARRTRAACSPRSSC